MMQEMNSWEENETALITERREVAVETAKAEGLWGYLWEAFVEAPYEKDLDAFAANRKRKSGELAQKAQHGMEYWRGELQKGRVGHT